MSALQCNRDTEREEVDKKKQENTFKKKYKKKSLESTGRATQAERKRKMRGERMTERRVVVDKCVWQEYSGDRCPMYSKQQ